MKAIRKVITAQAMMSGCNDRPASGGMAHIVELGGGTVELSGNVEFGHADSSHTMLR